MREIETSNRFYQEGDALYMTATVVTKLDTARPENSQITFILTPDRLITNRYVDPLPFRRFIAYADRHPAQCATAAAVLAGLLEAMVNRIADVLERTGDEMDGLSVDVFSPAANNGRRRDRDYRAILERVGRNGDLNSKARETLGSLARLVGFLQQANGPRLDDEVRGRATEQSRCFHEQQGAVPARCDPRHDQHRPEQHPQDLLGRDRRPAAAVGDRCNFRHELRRHPDFACGLGVLGSPRTDGDLGDRAVRLLQAARLAVTPLDAGNSADLVSMQRA
jgi:hypothetical protein